MRPKFLRVGPGGADGRPMLELELTSGEFIVVSLDRGHGRSIAERIIECVDGRVLSRCASRRVLELELVVEDDAQVAQTEPAPAAKRIA